jgi:hypothetical protein
MDINRSDTNEGVKERETQTLDSGGSKPKNKRLKLHVNRRLLIMITGGLVVGFCGSIAYWRFFIWQPAVVNPFSKSVTASVQFPLYYPTQVPAGYRVDTKSVTQPQQGVVVFNLIGPRGHKIYLSEEARPVTFDLGGFYNKFQDLKETPVTDGDVAVGRVSHGLTEIASRANNKTWILSNTTANIPLDQLTIMLKSLTPASI